MGETNPSLTMLLAYAYQRVGSGDRLRILKKTGVPYADITQLPNHLQIKAVIKRVVEMGLVEEFISVSNDVYRGYSKEKNESN